MDTIFGISLLIGSMVFFLWCFKKAISMAEERNQNKVVWIILCFLVTPLWACIILAFIKKPSDSKE